MGGGLKMERENGGGDIGENDEVNIFLGTLTIGM